MRDKQLGLFTSQDYDIVTEENAAELAQYLFDQRVCNHFPVVYQRFGTAMVHIEGHLVELVTARSESYNPENRHPLVKPATLIEDAKRRDFTINTLMENLHTGELYDPLGCALEDLNAKLLKTPLDPVVTFSDDPLRMLRAIRFAVKLNFTIWPEAYDAIKQEAQRLNIISFERIRDEMLKMMSYPNCSVGLNMLHDTGLLEIFAPELAQLKGLTQNEYHIYDVWEHTMVALDNISHEADVHTKFALLFHDTGKFETKSTDEEGRVHFYLHELKSEDITKRVLARLKFSNDEIYHILQLVKLHMRPGGYDISWSEGAVRRLIRDAGELMPQLLMLCKADASARKLDLEPPDFEALERRMAEAKAKMDVIAINSPLSGTEIIEYLKLTSGPIVGEYKTKLIDAVIEGELLPGDKEHAYKLLKSWHDG